MIIFEYKSQGRVRFETGMLGVIENPLFTGVFFALIPPDMEKLILRSSLAGNLAIYQ